MVQSVLFIISQRVRDYKPKYHEDYKYYFHSAPPHFAKERGGANVCTPLVA
jgi:hypothetical protein